jgi:hypothetical protein
VKEELLVSEENTSATYVDSGDGCWVEVLYSDIEIKSPVRGCVSDHEMVYGSPTIIVDPT